MSDLEQRIEAVETAAESAASHATDAHGTASEARAVAAEAVHIAHNATVIAEQDATLAKQEAARHLSDNESRIGALESWRHEQERILSEIAENQRSLLERISAMPLTPPQTDQTEDIAAETAIAVTEALVEPEALKNQKALDQDGPRESPEDHATPTGNAVLRPRGRWV